MADEGRGIEPEMLPRIFDLFVQGEQSIARQEGGLGSGLTLLRSLAAAAGSGKDRGALNVPRWRFIPRRQAHPESVAVPPA